MTTTPIPTDVLRAWVESVEPYAGWRGDEGEALYRAAVAALGPPRRPVTRETPNGKSIKHDEHGRRTFIGPGTRLREFWCETVPADANCRAELHYFDDGWYEIDEPEPCDWCRQDGCVPENDADCPCPHHDTPLPGTRVGDRMTEHTPVGAEVAHHTGHRRTIAWLNGTGAKFTTGGFGSFRAVWTVVALPEESER